MASGLDFLEAVTNTPDRFYKLAMFRIRLDFLAQTIDMRINRMLVAAMAVSPDLIE